MSTQQPDTAAPSPVTSVTLDGFDPESITAKVRSGFERTQLAPGRFSGQVLRARLRASQVDWGQYNLPLLATGQMPNERVILALLSGFRGQGSLNGHSIASPTPVLITEGATLEYRMPAHSQWFTFHLPRQLAEAAGMQLQYKHTGPLVAAPEQASRAASSINGALAAMREISQCSPEIPDPEGYLSQLEIELLDVFSAITAASSQSALRRLDQPAKTRSLVRRAMEIMEARLDQPLSIGEICQEVGCDWQRLERAFATVTGVTPKRFLTLARLNKARRLLLRAAPNQSVTRIAGSCGIHHLGRFSRNYRSVFDELPSTTLAGTPQRTQ